MSGEEPPVDAALPEDPEGLSEEQKKSVERLHTAEATEGAPEDRWPYRDPEEGHVYGFKCPATGAFMAAMTMETWQRMDETVKTLQRNNRDLELTNRQLRDRIRRQMAGTPNPSGGVIVDLGRNPMDPRQR